ncbi:MAG: MaoC family dehydratase [Thermoplasmatota archaeon]
MGLWFEDFKRGATFDHDGRLEVAQADNVAFCELTRNTQPLHLDAAAAKEQGFRDALVNGLYTFSASVGMSVPDLTEGTLIANMGYEDVRHPRPVFPGDVLRVRSEVLESRPSSKPGRGVVRIGHEVLNQDDEVVCVYNRTVLVRCRPESS